MNSMVWGVAGVAHLITGHGQTEFAILISLLSKVLTNQNLLTVEKRNPLRHPKKN